MLGIPRTARRQPQGHHRRRQDLIWLTCTEQPGNVWNSALVFATIQAKQEKPIPQVTIKTGIIGPNGREEQLTEMICDHPGCPNIATHVLGVVAELRLIAVVCDDHLPKNDRA